MNIHTGEKTTLLFLCTGNSARSQMAEGWLRHLAGERFEVFSAGLEPSVVNPLAIQAMAEAGVDISKQWSKHLDEYRGKKNFDYLITVCGHADENCPFFPGMGKRMHWGFEDPAAAQGTEEQRLKVFRQIRDQIKAKIEGWLKEKE